MTIVRVGATKKYSDGWESAFGKGKKATATTLKKSSGKKSAAAKASAKMKSSGKKGKKK